jgi:uncharacterized membrane protein YwaF
MAVSESNRRLGFIFWAAVVCLGVGLALTIGASAISGVIVWRNWITLSGSTSVLAAIYLMPRRPKLAKILIIVACVFSLTGLAGQIQSILR